MIAPRPSTTNSSGSPGHGAVPHLSAELFVRAAKIEMTHIPYRGAAPGIQDLIPGRIDSFFNNIAPMVPLSSQGQMRLLAVTTAKRAAMAQASFSPIEGASSSQSSSVTDTSCSGEMRRLFSSR